jgi:hypothetical protein
LAIGHHTPFRNRLNDFDHILRKWLHMRTPPKIFSSKVKISFFILHQTM